MATNGGSSSSNPTRMVTFITSDHKEVKVPVWIAREFGRVREFFDGDLDRLEVENAAPFPLPKVSSWILGPIVCYYEESFPLRSEFEALEKERLVEFPSKYEALKRERVLLPSKFVALEITRDFELPSKYKALEIARVIELPSKYQALEKKRQEFEAKFFGRQSDKTIVELVKAADFLEDEELLDSVMRSYRMRFGLGDDKGVDFVYTAEAEAILLRRAASASGGADED